MAKRAQYELSTDKTVLISSGHVAPVAKWIDGAPMGAPRPQDQEEGTGKLLWVLDCLVDDGADRATVVGVRVASNTEPHPVKYAPIAFESLTVSCYVQKATGNLVSMFAGVLKPAQAAKVAA